MNTTKTKTSKGRQKIEIKKIEKPDSRLTTRSKRKTGLFNKAAEIKKIEKPDSRLTTRSKRKTGLFNKAAELCLLTAADVAIIVKYPSGRTYAFGHPFIEAVTERFLGGSVGPQQELAVMEGMVRMFQERYDDVAKKRPSTMIAASNVDNSSAYWWNEPIDGLGLEELETYAAALEELKKKVAMKAENLMFMNDSNSRNFSSMLAMNPINENSGGLANNSFINQGLDSTSTNSLVSYGYHFDYSHGD